MALDIPLGTKIKKKFHGKWYAGEVVSIDIEKGKGKKKKKLFHVIFEDGDEEDLYEQEIAPLVVATAVPASAPCKRKATAPVASAKKSKTADPGSVSKTPHDAYFHRLDKFRAEHKDILGPMLIRGIPSSNDSDEDEDEDEDKDTSKYTKEQMDSLRFIMITKSRENQLETMSKLVLGDQYGDSIMMFNTSFSYDVLDSWHMLKTRLSRMTPAKKFDALLAYTHTVKQHDTWMHDNEGGMGSLIKGLATAWRNLLKKPDGVIGWDVQYTKPGVLELLGQFKREVEGMDACFGMGKFKFV